MTNADGAMRSVCSAARKKRAPGSNVSQGGLGFVVVPGAIGRWAATRPCVPHSADNHARCAHRFASLHAGAATVGPQRQAEACSRCGHTCVVAMFGVSRSFSCCFRLFAGTRVRQREAGEYAIGPEGSRSIFGAVRRVGCMSETKCTRHEGNTADGTDGGG